MCLIVQNSRLRLEYFNRLQVCGHSELVSESPAKKSGVLLDIIRIIMKKNIIIALIGMLFLAGSVFAAQKTAPEPEFIPTIDIQLPEPQTSGGMPLVDALKNRKTDRAFSSQELDEQTLSNLLWAANGINRPDGKHTAPSAMNHQEVVIYAVLPKGVFYYYPKGHFLKRVMKEDIRPLVGNAPLTLLYAANLTQQTKMNAACDIGFIGQNVYLFAAANGLGTVFKGSLNTAAIDQKLELRLGQEVLYGQAVGYPLSKKK